MGVGGLSIYPLGALPGLVIKLRTYRCAEVATRFAKKFAIARSQACELWNLFGT